MLINFGVLTYSVGGLFKELQSSVIHLTLVCDVIWYHGCLIETHFGDNKSFYQDSPFH